MSQKVKSSLFLGGFIAVYSFYIGTFSETSFPEGNTTQVTSVEIQHDVAQENLHINTPE